MKIRNTLIAAILTLLSTAVQAQYYSQGQDPASLHWRQLKTNDWKVVFPDYFTSNAYRIGAYLEAVRSADRTGFTHPANRIPIAVHTLNTQSNGFVAWAPKRMELIAMPPIEASSVPWLRQLTAHEYRHVVQLSNLNHGLVKFGGYLLGQQLLGAVTGLLPGWLYEGDATWAETQLATFGRGMQPDFTIGYRALLASGVRYRAKKWVCGSYKDYVPDHYHLGYQTIGWAYTYLSPNLLSEVFDHTARYPFLFLNFKWILYHRYHTTRYKMIRATLSDLNTFWESLPPRDDSQQILPTPLTSYTTYESPILLDDTTAVAVKSDFDRLKRLVAVDLRSGEERTLCSVNRLTTRPRVAGRTLYWTELTPSRVWEQKNFSQICRMSFDDPQHRVIRSEEKSIIYFVTPTENGEIAYVKYLAAEGYRVVNNHRETALSDTLSVHGMAYDIPTKTLSIIGLSDCGIGIYRVTDKGLEPILAPSRVTVDQLNAADGKLYFSSIESGYDEVHSLDLRTHEQHRLTCSKFGSRAGDCRQGTLLSTLYTPQGYRLGVQSAEKIAEPVAYKQIPDNRVNPPRYRWNVLNLDTVQVRNYTPDVPVKRYRQGANLFNIHSWAPISYDPIEVGNEQDLNQFKGGATVMSQNLLGNMICFVTYGYDPKTYDLWRTRINYFGLAPKFELEVQLGGRRRNNYIDSRETLAQIPVERMNQRYMAVRFKSYLPLNFSRGNRNRYLTPSIEYNFTNALLAETSHGGVLSLAHNLQYAQTKLDYTDNSQLAYRDFLPRNGYGIQLRYLDAFAQNFAAVYSIYGQLYLPGVMLHHSLKLRTAAQYQTDANYRFVTKTLYPRGANDDETFHTLCAAAIDYQLPIAYPDWNINGMIYFKRFRLNVGFDYAQGKAMYGGNRSEILHRNSYGADLLVDFNPFCSSSSLATFKLSLYKPNNFSKVATSVDLNINF